MSVQTMSTDGRRVTRAAIRVSMNGSGLKHYHLIVSRTTGLNGATTARTYDAVYDASLKAAAVRDAYVADGYAAREIHNRTILEVSKNDVRRYVFVRPCTLRHAR